MNKYQGITVVLVMMFMIAAPGVSVAGTTTCFNIVDEQGSVVYQTGWKVQVGDQCLTAENIRYEVTQVVGEVAQAKY